MEKQVCFYDGGHDMWKVWCDTVYVNDEKAVDDWLDRHDDVWAEPFENGYEFHDEFGGHMFHITDFMRITVTVEKNVEVWYVE